MRRPDERNIILIGMPGAGKTTIGKLVAARLGREFYDSDAEIEAREGFSCAKLIRGRGENAFREIEREVIADLTQKRGIVLAVGGGAPVYSEELLRQNSIVFYIHRDLEEIAEYLDDETRPLSSSLEDLEYLFHERAHVYAELAHISVHNNDVPERAAEIIVNSSRLELRARLLVLNGPNLNMLGVREPEIYGSATLDDLKALIVDAARERGIMVRFSQSNHEGDIIETIHDTMGRYDGIVINPGAYTHYSYAIYDALKSVDVPAVEVHISDITGREEFRKISVTAPACVAQVYGEGFAGYVRAVDILLERIL